ncbi:MAG: hypothetical protein GX087_05200, partial [Desulfobulbaceae bacterium]|nr:hypothetical protein [Desulfobulbaceae bacterium]
MKAVKEIKKVQVDGKKYLMPVEDVDVEKLIQKGLRLNSLLKNDFFQMFKPRRQPHP